MVRQLSLVVNGQVIQVEQGTSVAAALLMAGEPSRRSVSGEGRMPFCGMGICMECRATVDGVAHQRTCQMLCREGMEVASE